MTSKLPRWEVDSDLLAWAYAELEQRWDSDNCRHEQMSIGLYDPRSAEGFADDAAITAAEALNFVPLVARLRSGRVSPDLVTRWLPAAIERGLFAQRKGRRQKLEAPTQRAVRDLPSVEALLAVAFPNKKRIREKALTLVAMRHHVGELEVGNLLKRSRRDRRRISP